MQGASALRIVLLTDYYPPLVGGGPVFQEELATRLAARGHEVTVITLRLPATPARSVERGVTVVRTGPDTAGRYSFLWRGLAELRRLCRRDGPPDVLHATTFLATLPAWAASRSSRLPTVLTVYEVFDEEWARIEGPARGLNRLHRLAERRLLRLRFAHVVAISPATALRLQGKVAPGQETSVILPGVDEQFWDPGKATVRRDADAGFTFGYFGRAGSTKGVMDLLQAAALALPRIPNGRLVAVLGQGPLREPALEQVQNSAVLSRCVTVLGAMPKDRLRDTMAAVDAVVVPSLSEGFGLVVAEAGSLRVPVIATSVGPLPDVVSGKHLLVPPRDPERLAAAMEAAARGEWQEASPKSFPWDRTVTEYERVFERAARRP